MPPHSTMKLLSAFATASLATAALYAREDGDSVTVSTISPESTSLSVMDGSTTDVTILATTSSWTLGTGESATTDVTVEQSTEVWTIGAESIDTTLGTEVTTFIVESNSQSEVILTAIDTTFTLTSISTVLSISELKTAVSMDPVTTTVIIPDSTTEVTFEDLITTITVSGTSSQVVITGTPNEVTIPGTDTTVEIESATASVSIDSASTSVSVDAGSAASTITLSYTASSPVSLTYTTTEIVTLTRSSSIVQVSLESTTVTLSVDQIVTTLTAGGSTSEITIPAEVTTITLSGSTSETTIPGEESTATVPESSESTTESESSSTEESTTSEESSTEPATSEESSSTSGTATSPTAPAPTPTANPTYCEVVRGPLTPEEEVQLQVLFSDRAGASAFADYVVSYASQLVAQISDVANIAVGDNNYAFTTAFNTIDIPGILGLASAAPIYTCFLSSLWAEALSNPQQYAKRAVPTQDEKIKLIVLFEKRENSGMDFDYAELLVDETNDLIAEVQNVSAAAANGDLGAYASLFANVDVPYFLSIATEAPIYTEGLSAALQTALASYSESAFRPTVTTMTTRTFTTVNTIVTNFVNGTVTVPTTIVSTETVVTVEPVGQVQATSTALQAAPAPAPTANAPVNKVTTEVVTLGNGRVETRTVTICVENCDTVVAESTRRPAAVQTVTTRPNVAIYTQVQNGVTYTHTIEIQTKNAALKKVAALGAGIPGGAALLL